MTRTGSTWAEFAAEAPELAEAGWALLSQFGLGLAFIATTRPDGGPRLHPICVIQGAGGLFVSLVPSPKLRDLERDPRFALHSYPPEQLDDEFAITGRVVRIDDMGRRAEVQQHYRNPINEHDTLLELFLESALLARYKHRGDWPPAYTRWRLGRGVDHPVSGSVTT